MARSVTHVAVRPALSLAIEPSAFTKPLFLPSQAARQMRLREASISVAMSASMNAIDWFMMIGRPKASRSLAYCNEYSKAARATPSAWAPTAGRVASKVCIAACELPFSPRRTRARRSSSFSLPPSRQRPGTRTSSRTTSAVWLARMPCFLYFWPCDRPFVFGGTTNDA